MSSRTWYFLSGLALLIGDLLAFVFFCILFQILITNGNSMFTSRQSPSLQSPIWLFFNLMLALGSVLIVIGLPAVYAHVSKRAQWTGVIGLVFIQAAILIMGAFGTALNYFGIRFSIRTW